MRGLCLGLKREPCAEAFETLSSAMFGQPTVMTSVRAIGGREPFFITVGLYRVCALGPYLFAFVIDELISRI